MGLTPRRFAPTCACRAWGAAWDGRRNRPTANQARRGPSTTKGPTSQVGRQMGNIPTIEKADILCAALRFVGRTRRNMSGRGKYPTRWWAEPDLSRNGVIERAQHGGGDRGGAVAAVEFARLEPRGKGAVDGGLDGAGGLRGPAMAVTVGEPVEHQRGGENHGGRIGQPLAHDVGRGAVAGLEHRVRVADVGRGR